jgi:predicted GIY-YIG superfamily endonuclease
MYKTRNEHYNTAEEVHDEVRGVLGDTDNTGRHVTYLLRCDNNRSSEEFSSDLEERFQSPPSWVCEAHEADHALYVGATTDLRRRFVEHCFDDDRGAVFTGFFPPLAIVAVSEFRSAAEVFNSEAKMASKAEAGYREQYDIPDGEGVFVYQA